MRLALPALLILAPWALAFVVYAPRLSDYFALDDFVLLRAVHGRDAASVIARSFTLPEATPFEAPMPFWRPAADCFFYVEYLLFGLRSTPYHVVNVGLHALVATLGGVFAARLTRSTATGLATGALFVVAPTYSFAVTWVSQISELLGATFSLIALLTYHGYLTNRDHRRAPLLMGGAMLALAIALLCKESAIVTIPLLAGPHVLVPREGPRRSVRAILIELSPLGVVALVFGGIYLLAEYQGSSSGDSYKLGSHIFSNLWDVLKRMTFPYATNHSTWVGTAQAWTAIGYLTLGAAALVQRRRLPAFFFLWSLAALLPYSLFRSGIEWRYTYLATLPCVAFLVTSTMDLLRVLPSAARTPAALVFVLAVAAAVAAAPSETRAQQVVLVDQARASDVMLGAVRETCGNLPPESHVFIVGDPTFDPYGVNTTAAVNLLYDRAYVSRSAPPEELAGFLSSKCVVRFQVVP